MARLRTRDEVWALDLEAGAWSLLGRYLGPIARHSCADDPGLAGVVVSYWNWLGPVDPAAGIGMAEE